LANAELISLFILRELRVKSFLINYRYLMASGIHQNFFDSENTGEPGNLARMSGVGIDGNLEFGTATLSPWPVRPLIQNLDSISISPDKAKHDLQL
jgi:hypothetical protein